MPFKSSLLNSSVNNANLDVAVNVKVVLNHIVLVQPFDGWCNSIERAQNVRLGDYLKRLEMSQAYFGSLSNLSQTTVNRYVSGRRMPKPEHILAVHHATGGLVTANDFFWHFVEKNKLGDAPRKGE